jgi:HEAT repeat protein/S1-C subfamily serine protease
MIRYACPKCDTSLKSAEDTAGTKTACPRCGERFEVPAAAPEKAASGKERNGASKPSPSRKPAAGAAKKKPVKGDSRDQKGSKTPVLVFAGIGVAAIAVVAIVAVLLLTKKDDKVASSGSSPTTPVPPISNSTTPSAPTTQAAGTSTVADKGKEDKGKENGTAGGASTQGTEKQDTQGAANTPPPPEPKKGTLNHQIYEQLLGSTFFIVNKLSDRPGLIMGSGSLIDRKNKLILTNWHVVMDSPRGKMYAFFPEYDDGQLVKRKDVYLQKLLREGEWGIRCFPVTGVEQSRRDLALLKLGGDVPPEAKVLKLARGSAREGDSVHSLGNPGASDACWVYTTGNVRQVYHAAYPVAAGAGVFTVDCQIVETTSPTNPGDSGGPMVNDRGELVAVTHAGRRGAHLMSKFIDVSEVKAMVSGYYHANNLIGGLEIAPGREPPKELSGLIKALDERDPQSKREAAEKLGELGEDARKAVPGLAKNLKDQDESVRLGCAQALELIGGVSASELPAIVEVLKDSNADIRKACAGALGKMGPQGGDAAGPLAELLKDPETVVRKAAASSLGKIGPPAKAAVPQLAKALKDDQSSAVRGEAARSLARMGPQAVLKDLTDALAHDSNSQVRLAIMDTIGSLRGSAKEAIPALTKVLDNDKNPDLRNRAISTLAAMGPDARELAPKLGLLLERQELRGACAHALASIGKDAVKPLRDALNSNKWEVREVACHALMQIGDDAKAALPELARLMKLDPNERSKRAAANAYNKIQGD